MTSSTSWFTSEIQQMMFGLGDSKRPQLETCQLVEEIVHQQMVAMIIKVWDVTVARGDMNISIEDILFLLRKDKTKLHRLLRYYEVKDLKEIIKSNTVEECKNINLNGDKNLTKKKTMGKNLKACYDFLSTIDQTGELLELFKIKEIDAIKHERMVRAEIQAQGLDAQAYDDFCKARQANFSPRYSKTLRFRDWLATDINPEIVFTTNALEMFSYLAYETVAQIVDLALLVKQDRRARPGDPMSRYKPALCITYSQLQAGTLWNKGDNSNSVNSMSLSPPSDGSSTTPSSSNKRKRKKSGSVTSVDQSWDTSIMPSDVHEAMRRYYSDISPLASSMKFNPNNSPWHKTLCC